MLEEIKNTFDNIRDALIEAGADVSECDSPTTYANRILSLAQGTGLNVTCILAFKSSETKPETPTTPASASEPQNLPDGWSTPDGLTGTIWMTYTIVGNTYIYVPWTEPIQITNIKNKITRTFTIYLELSSRSVTPGLPEGGYWDSERNILTGDITSILSNGNIGHWSTTNSHVNGSYTWISSATFSSDATDNSYGVWSTPICINAARDGIDGVDGRDGADGCNAEYIYKLVTDLVEFENLPTPPSNPTVTDYVPEGWADHPIGIDAEHQIEAVCVRLLKNGQWGSFSAPVIWSIWSESGIDGDGIEYIFTTVAASATSQDSDGAYHINPSFYPPMSEQMYLTVTRAASVSDAEALERYQQDEFIPGDSAADLGWDRNWVDNSINVTSQTPFVFCSKRKYDGSTHSWGWFDEPVLWSKYPYTDTSSYMINAYTKSYLNLTTASVSGKTYDSDHGVVPAATTLGGEPLDIDWYSTVPDNLKGDVWMVSCLYGDQMETLDWTSPKKLSDTNIFQIEYSANYDWENKPQLDNLNGYIDATAIDGVNEAAWRTAMHNADKGDWSDNANGAIYMATCHKINGSWTDWVVARVQDDIVRGQVSTLQADFAQIDTIIANKVNTMSLSAEEIHCDSENVGILIKDGLFEATSTDPNNHSKVIIGIDTDGCPQLLFFDETGTLKGGYTKNGWVANTDPVTASIFYSYPRLEIDTDPNVSERLNAIRSWVTASSTQPFWTNGSTKYLYQGLWYNYASHQSNQIVEDGIYKSVGNSGSAKLDYVIYNPIREPDLENTSFLTEYTTFATNFPDLDPSSYDGEHFSVDTSALVTAFHNYQVGDPDEPFAITVRAEIVVNGIKNEFIIYCGTNVLVGTTGVRVPYVFENVLNCLNITLNNN